MRATQQIGCYFYRLPCSFVDGSSIDSVYRQEIQETHSCTTLMIMTSTHAYFVHDTQNERIIAVYKGKGAYCNVTFGNL